MTYPDELRADIQQFYHLDIDDFNLDGAETTRPIHRLAALTSQLPPESRVARAAHPELRWETSDYLLRQIEFQIRALMWSLGGGKGEKPQLIPSPDEYETRQEAQEREQAKRDSIAAMLGL